MRQTKKVSNLWCGYNLSLKQQKAITILAMLEFRKPIALRRLPFQLVEIARGDLKINR